MQEYPGFVHQTNIDTIAEAQRYQNIFSYYKNAEVLDIGAGIGASTYLALRNKAKYVTLIEPSKRNYEHLNKQPFIERFCDKIEIIQKVVVGDTYLDDKIFFFENMSMDTINPDTGLDSVIKTKKRAVGYLVDCVGFIELINEIKPDVLSVNVVGEEEHFDFSQINSCVQAIAIKIYPQEYGTESLRVILKRLQKRFPKILYKEDKYLYDDCGLVSINMVATHET